MGLFPRARKETGHYTKVRERACHGRRQGKKPPTKTPDGKLTVWGAYESVLLNIQNFRRWGNSTCRAYDRIFFKYTAKIFDGIAYESLNRKTAEEIWKREVKIFDGDKNLELRARNIFSYFAEEAYRSGFSTMTLWDNSPFEIPEDLSLLSPEQQEVLREAAERWKRRLKSLTIEAEIRICNELLRQAEEHGECVPLLIMLLLGFRTSEAAGLSFGDIRKMDDMLYSIERRYVAKAGGSREVEEGGKTDNSYRLLPLAAPLYELLEARRQRVLDYLKETGQEHIDIDMVPLGCRGKDFLTRCTTKEMNEAFKRICCDAGVDEGAFFETEAMMAIDKEAGQEYENMVVAYVLRHQFATELILTDASRAEISVLMGHKIVNPDVKAYDFANADGQRELLRVLMQRPIYRYLCDTLEPEQALTPPSMIDVIGRITREAKERVEKGEFAEKPKMLIECEDPLSRLATVEDLYTDGESMVTDMEGTSITVGKKRKAAATQPEKIAVCKNALCAISCKKKQIQALKTQYHCYDTVKKSEKAMDMPQTISSVIAFHEGIDQLVVSKAGSAWYLPAEVASKDFLESEEWQPCREALLAGGIVVPRAASADSLVCVAQNGELVRLPMEKLHLWKGEKQLVQVKNTSLVSACCCFEADDLLLVSAQGKVLRLHVAELRMRSGLGGGLVRGMALAPDDALCKCMIYQPERSLTVISQQGQILALSPEIEAQKPITAKGRGSQGVALMALKGSDRIADVLYAEQAVLLVLDTGYAHCRAVDRLTKCERGSQGVRGTKGNCVICAAKMENVES